MLPPLEQPLGGLGPATRAVLGQLRGLADAPHEITIEVAAQLSTDAALIFARAGADADFRIALKWMREPPPSPTARCPRTADTGMIRRGVGWRATPGIE
jgi:NTP-dependent ternary system trypsin peptidase co-occuring protein